MAETPRIRSLSRQDVIRTAVPRAFTGGSPERGIITSQSEQFSKAIDNLIEAGVPLSAKLHKEYREEEINKGIFRVSKASDATLKKLRDGVVTGVLNGEESEAYVEGVDRGLLRVESRRFGENALLDWRKSKEYNDPSPDAFSRWMQNYRADFNRKFVDGMAPDLIAEELLPRQNAIINQLQQRHQEKQARDYEYNAVLNMQQDMKGQVNGYFKDYKFLNWMNNYFYQNPTGSLKEVHDDPVLGTDNLGKVAGALQSQSKQLSIGSEDHRTLVGFSKRILEDPLFNGTRIQEQASSFLDKYEFADFEVTKEDLQTDLNNFGQALNSSPLMIAHELYEYVNSEPDVRYQLHGINPKTANQSMIDILEELGEDYEKPALLQGLINSFDRGRNTEYANKAIESGNNRIYTTVTRRFNLENKTLERLKLSREDKLFVDLSNELKQIPEDQYQIQLPKLISKYVERAIIDGNRGLSSTIESFLKNVGDTEGIPNNEQITELHQIWVDNLDNPDIALREVQRFALKEGVLFDKLPNASFYKQEAENTLNYKEKGGLYSSEFSSIRRMIAKAVDPDNKLGFSIDANGQLSFGSPDGEEQYNKEISRLVDYWTKFPKKSNEEYSDFFERIRQWTMTNIVNPISEKEEQANATQTDLLLRQRFNKEFPKELSATEQLQKATQDIANSVEEYFEINIIDPYTREIDDTKLGAFWLQNKDFFKKQGYANISDWLERWVDIRTYLNVTKDSENPEIVDDSLKINYDE